MRIVLVAFLLFWSTKPADLTLHDLSGKRTRLKDYRGQVVVLNFWATWCGPCRQEMPMLVEAEKVWSAKGVKFIAVSLDGKDTSADIPAFVDKFKMQFPVWTGASSEELDQFHLGAGVPDTVFIDQDGTVFSRVLGQIQRDELTERLNWLTGDHTAARPAELVKHM